MKLKVNFVFILLLLLQEMSAQQNWVGIPCYKPNQNEEINRMFIDSLHNEIILNSNYGHKACNSSYKGVFRYDGNLFKDLDFGLNKFDPNLAANGYLVMDCIPYNNKTLFGGGFISVGSNTLYTKSIALWNGAVWDTFPKHVFSNKDNGSGGGFNGFFKHKGKLWMYGKFDTIGNTISKNLCNFDGNNFTPLPAIPDYDNDYIIGKAKVYDNKIVVTGDFYDPNSWSSRVAMYDGITWASVGIGVKGSLAAVVDLAIYRDTLYIAGSWSKTDGNVSNHIMKWDGTQLFDAGFGNFYSWAGITSLVVYRDRLYALGPYDHAANKKAYGISYYQNGTWTVPQDSIGNYGVRYGVVYNDALYIAGAFKNIGKDTTIKNFAWLACPDFDAASGCLSGIKENSRNRLNLKLFPNPATDKIFLQSEYSLNIEKLEIINSFGQIVLAGLSPGIIKDSNTWEVDISKLSKGIYFLKAENNRGQSVFKIVKE
ncbi:MAG: T9SS type A sorting domain-containing protein [Bacteroidia bacterium]|nr:T9SS type A sorting domain-containing protein [Bacteroidia bacterium]